MNPVSFFDRKHYFYPDMPNNYQITQHRVPLGEHGFLDVGPLVLWPALCCLSYPSTPPPPHLPGSVSVGSRCVGCCRWQDAPLRVAIERLQLEQDSGKSIHTLSPTLSCIDLNRAGMGLMEIVTAPAMQSGEEAAAFVTELLDVLRAIGSCHGNLAGERHLGRSFKSFY